MDPHANKADSLLGRHDSDVTSQARVPRERWETPREEIANSVSHGLGFLASLAAAPLLILHAMHKGDLRRTIGVSVFAATIALLYLTSTLYHALPRGKSKHVFRLIEHAAIFFLIAGTYTPFTLGVLRGPWGWTLFGIVWTLAAAGLVLKLIGGVRYPVISTLLYLGTGWVVVVAIRPLWLGMPHSGIMWLLLGGLAYTGGIPFFAVRRPYSHFIWHLFVLAGTTIHFFTVLWYAA